VVQARSLLRGRLSFGRDSSRLRPHDATHADLQAHGRAFVAAYSLAKHLKALRSRTPFRAVCGAWADDSHPFRIDPHHLIPEPNKQTVAAVMAGSVPLDGSFTAWKTRNI
jgi:hypothetical protein